MADGNCEGCGTSSCCCGEITRIRGGLHSDVFIHIVQIIETNKKYQLCNFDCNLVHFSIWPRDITDAKRMTARLYSSYYSAETDSETAESSAGGSILMLGATASTTEPVVADDMYFGSWFPHGVYVETTGHQNPSTKVNDLMVVNAIVIERENFSPAYMPPIEVHHTYWNCWNPGRPFLDEFAVGLDSDIWAGDDDGNGSGMGVSDAWVKDAFAPGFTGASKTGRDKSRGDVIQLEDDGGDGEGGTITYSTLKLEDGRPAHANAITNTATRDDPPT